MDQPLKLISDSAIARRGLKEFLEILLELDEMLFGNKIISE